MHIQKAKNKITAIVLSALLVIASVCVFPSIPASAATTADLYGTGSADEISVLKLLDMALNKGGMSMSADTIKAFLEYWWTCVSEDMETIIADADTSITTTADFVEWLGTADIDSDWFTTILKYVRFAATMETKTLSDFYTLLRQPDTFRQFLLSYVTDESGNIAGTVNNKLTAAGKYYMGSDLVNVVREAADMYVDEYEGYFLMPSFTWEDVSVSHFATKSQYEFVVNTLKTIPDGMIFITIPGNTSSSSWNFYFYNVTGYDFVGKRSQWSSSKGIVYYSADTIAYNSNWEYVYPKMLLCSLSTLANTNYFNLAEFESDSMSMSKFNIYPFLQQNVSNYPTFFTSDDRTIKIWKSLDGLKAHTVGKDNIYYGSGYANYDASVDNSYTFTGSYYNNTSSTYSHEVIQNQIDNSTEVNESTVNNIVNNYITNNYGDGGGSGDGSGGGSGDGSGGGSGSGGGGWWNIGDGISSFIEGIGSLLDFVLKLLGDLISLLGKFLSSVLEVLGALSEVGSGFGTFLTSFFDFLPEECIDLIMLSIAGMCIAGVIKAFVK